MNDQADIRPRIGLFGIGLDTYWPQFDGLLTRLTGYQRTIAERLRGIGADLVDAGMVDNPDKARQAASRFRREEVDLIFLYVSTYALSSTVLPVVQEAGVPVVVLNLQPVAQLDYDDFNRLGDRGVMTGVWLEHCQACSAPEIACVFNRAGISYHLVTGYLTMRRPGTRLATGSTPPRSRPGCGTTAWACWGITTAACWTSIAT